MIISKERKAIFIHVQKTGGISIQRTLEENLDDAKLWLGRHSHASEALAEIGPEKWSEYFSFAFVRNPWDRLVSWYSMVQGMRKNLPFWKRMKKEPFDSPFHNQIIKNSNDFESFLYNCTDVVYEKGCNKSYAFNQVDYLSDAEGNIVVDFIGKFEKLAEGMKVVYDKLGIAYDPLPKKNPSKHTHYSDYYTNKTRDLIAERFKKDIEAFNYQFETR